MALTDLLRNWYHALVPYEVRLRLRLGRLDPTRRATRLLWAQTGGAVAWGPLAGTRLVARTPDDLEPPLLSGAYESDLHPALERLVAWTPATVVNIGANLGLYSSGLARRLPGATVVAYELDAALHPTIAESARRNGVSHQVRIEGGCTPDGLAALAVAGRVAVVCDCEGAEGMLLDPARVPWLRSAWLLVELHDFAVPGVEAQLRARFGESHLLATVHQTLHRPELWAERLRMPTSQAALLVDERRAFEGREMLGRWLVAEPK